MCGPLSRGVEHHGVVGNAQFVQLVEEQADVFVVLKHAAAVFVHPRVEFLARRHFTLAHVRAEVHARAAPPDEPRLAGSGLAFDEVQGGG